MVSKLENLNIEYKDMSSEQLSKRFEAFTSRKNSFLILIVLGIMLRIILMPFFGHLDIMSTYQRAYEVAFGNASLLEFDQILSHAVEVVNLHFYNIFFDINRLTPFSTDVSVNSSVNLNLIFFKIPYLLFDIGCLYLLKKLLDGQKDRNKILYFYFLNPILLFAVYIFGRYEVFPIFFILGSLLMIQDKRYFLSALLLGLAVLTRTSMLVLLPIFFVALDISMIKRFFWGLIAVLPYGIVFFYKLLTLRSSNDAEWVSGGHHVSFFFNNQFQLGFGEEIYLYIVVYTLILFAAWFNRVKANEEWKAVALYSGLALSVYYATSNYHPQYLAWVIPFVAILLAYSDYKKQILYAWLGVSLMLFPLLLTWGDAIYMQTALPINHELGSYDLIGVINQYIPPHRIANFARSVISALFIVISYYTIKNPPVSLFKK